MEKLNNRFITVVLASALVAISSSALAGSNFRFSSKAPVHQQPQHFKGYVYGYGGIDFGAEFQNAGFFDHLPNTEVPTDWELNNGWTAGGGIGAYSGILGGSRFEIEGSFTSNNVGTLLYDNYLLRADFKIKTEAVMFNMLKEIPLGGATAYFGGGVGYASTSMEGDIATIEYDDYDAGFAWQLIMGIDIPITERLALFTQYRYMVLSDMSFTAEKFGDFTYTTDKTPASHAVVIGARVSF